MKFDLRYGALVLIDLQPSIINLPLVHNVDRILDNSVKLADAFRRVGLTVILVHLEFSADQKDRIGGGKDKILSKEATSVIPTIHKSDKDVIITKKNWGAFYGTDMDLQLRRRRIDTIVLAGIATSIGVESTARDAYERNYKQIFIKDAMTDLDEICHDNSINRIFPKIGNVMTTSELFAHF
jgi:nicotinamidase-related amidase